MTETALTTRESIAVAPPGVAVPASAVDPPAMLDLFGKPALLRSEDANLYDALFARVVAAARPRDVFEWILLKDYADLAWEIFRLRRAKAGFVAGMRTEGLCRLLNKLGLSGLSPLRWYSDPNVKAAILEQLSARGLDEDVITAEAVVASADRLAKVETMIASAETRRNAMLREIDYHRAGFAARLRAAPGVIDAETEDAPAGAETRAA
jgi:hypothetical protein